MSIADLCRACGVMGIGLGLLAAPAWAHWEKDSAHYTASEISSRQDAGLLASVPVGTVIMWPGTEAPGPAGHWLKLDGSTFDAAKYPDLARILGGNRLPDGRGVFMVGVQPGERLGERLAADAGEHEHLLATKTVTSPRPAAAPLPPPPATTDSDEPGTPVADPENPDSPQTGVKLKRSPIFGVHAWYETMSENVEINPLCSSAFVCVNGEPVFLEGKGSASSCHAQQGYKTVSADAFTAYVNALPWWEPKITNQTWSDAWLVHEADFRVEHCPPEWSDTCGGREMQQARKVLADVVRYRCVEIADGPFGVDFSDILGN